MGAAILGALDVDVRRPVVACVDIEEKRRILESWKKDAELLSTAQDENMAGGERPQLQDVSIALGALDRSAAE